MHKPLIIGTLLFFFGKISAQRDSSTTLTFSGFTDIYFATEFDEKTTHERPGFLYNHRRVNEVNVNLAFLKAQFSSKKSRANIALMTGNYAQHNLAAEPVANRFLFEANAGIRLSKSKNIWLDAGVLPSHIGFESAISTDCATLTRSLVAENSPYFGTGAKLSWASRSEKWAVAALVLNGWQRIQRPDGFNRPAFGAQVFYKTGQNWSLNYSNFIGSDRPDSLSAWRAYHNFYAISDPEKSWQITAGLDFGFDEKPDGRRGNWFAPVIILRKNLAANWKTALRAEYFLDKNQTLIATGTPNGFRVAGLSANLDWAVSENALLRVEGRFLSSKDKIFEQNGLPANSNPAATASLAVRF